ncbi:MAG: hypothetical protein NXH72_11755 [Hyphomonadaceae bacterium]|nr:hypothetical protein [Hyphomonadaceae bacterium]
MKGIPNIQFDPSDLSQDQAMTNWSEVFKWMHDARPIERPDRPFSSKANSWIVDSLVVSQGRYDLQVTAVDESQVPFETRNFLFCWVVKSGTSHVLHDGRVRSVGPNTYCIFDNARAFHAISTDTEFMCAVVPHSTISYDPLRHPANFQLDVRSRHGKALSENLGQIISEAPGMRRPDAVKAAQAHYDLLIDLLRQPEDALQPEFSQRDRLRAQLDELLLQPDFQFDDMMTMHELSRASLIQILDLPVSLETYVRTRRLDYAFRSLAFGPDNPERLGKIAHHSGFASESEFIQACEAQFDFHPQIVLGKLASAKSLLTAPQAPLWDRWYMDETDA